jgi:hypothetical protein
VLDDLPETTRPPGPRASGGGHPIAFGGPPQIGDVLVRGDLGEMHHRLLLISW